LSVNDIQVSSDLYKREIERVGKEIADLSKLDLSKSRKLREKERLKALEQKLSQELNRQTEHVTRVRTLLTKYKEELFAKPSICMNLRVINANQA
jgi:septal ring factor EnvC (AmiA/AmiB activator)